MRTLIRLLFTLLLGAGAALVLAIAPASASPPPPRELGAPNLTGYAIVDRFADFHDAHSWQCRV